jgi:hypothetical protein
MFVFIQKKFPAHLKIFFKNDHFWAGGGMAEIVEHLPSRCEACAQIQYSHKKKKKKDRNTVH